MAALRLLPALLADVEDSMSMAFAAAVKRVQESSGAAFAGDQMAAQRRWVA